MLHNLLKVVHIPDAGKPSSQAAFAVAKTITFTAAAAGPT
jgi:hypothetical protein